MQSGAALISNLYLAGYKGVPALLTALKLVAPSETPQSLFIAVFTGPDADLGSTLASGDGLSKSVPSDCAKLSDESGTPYGAPFLRSHWWNARGSFWMIA